jgi:hypothetical protein
MVFSIPSSLSYVATCTSESVNSIQVRQLAEMVKMLFSFVGILVASASQHNMFFFFRYRLQQVEDVLEEEKFWTFFRTHQEFSMLINQVSSFSQRLEKS